jgi:hypothetical protein
MGGLAASNRARWTGLGTTVEFSIRRPIDRALARGVREAEGADEVGLSCGYIVSLWRGRVGTAALPFALRHFAPRLETGRGIKGSWLM